MPSVAFQPGAHCFSIVFVNDEFIIAVFHLAKILDIVASVNNEIYLRPFPMAAVSIGIRFHAPGISLTQHAGYSKFLFYLSKVMQAYLLKGVPCPCVLLASFTVFCPVMLILSGTAAHESQVKQREHICQLIELVPDFIPRSSIASYEIARFQVVQHF